MSGGLAARTLHDGILLDANEVATRIGVSPHAARSMMRKGTITAEVRYIGARAVWRTTADAVKQFLQTHPQL